MGWLASEICSTSLALCAGVASDSNCCCSISQGDSAGLAVTAPPATGSDSAWSVRLGVQRSSMYWFALCMSSTGTSAMVWATAAPESMQKRATVDSTTATSFPALCIGLAITRFLSDRRSVTELASRRIGQMALFPRYCLEEVFSETFKGLPPLWQVQG